MFEFPDALGEYAPFASRRRDVIELVKGLRLSIGPGGRLSNPAIDQNKFPEFNQALRTAYALRCTPWLKKTPDPVRSQIEAWILAHYSESHCLETHDIAFLTDILYAKNQHES